MQGIFVQPQGHLCHCERPASKKDVKELAASAPERLALEATSLFGNEYDGSVANAPDGTYLFVGPDPYTSRKFYGKLTVSGGKVRVA